MAETFTCALEWTGAGGGSTASANYSRDLAVTADHTAELLMSAGKRFKGDEARWNPEQLLGASLAACQALTYLHMAQTHNVEVVAYADAAEATLGLVNGAMAVTKVVLRPRITLGLEADRAKAESLVERAHAQCFVANAVSAAVIIEPSFDSRET